MSIAETAASEEAARPADVVRHLVLHPGSLLMLVWAAVLGIWWLIPDSTFVSLTLSEKHVSRTAIAFFVAAVGAFALGTVAGPTMLRSERPIGLSLRHVPSGATRTLAAGTQWIFAIGVAASLYLVFAGSERAGGFSALLGHILAGGSWSELAEEYFVPARIALVTVWMHLIVAVAPLSAVAAVVASDARTRRRLFGVLGLGLLIALLISFIFAERLIAFAYIVAAAVAWAAASRLTHHGPSHKLNRRARTRLAALAVLIAGLWILGEFSRTYLATRETSRPVGVADVQAGTPLAAQRFLAYVVTSTNNGMVAVDELESRQYAYRTLSAVFTALGWEDESSPLVGHGNAERRALLHRTYPYGDPLTTFSLPGEVFADLGWAGLGILFWFGALIGFVFSRFERGELWAVCVYPLCLVGILDSFRIMYWGRTEMVVPTLAIAVLMGAVYAAARRTAVGQRVDST